MPFTTAVLNNLLNATHGKANYTAPTSLFVGLTTSTSANIAAGTVVEPSGGNYARKEVSPASFGTAANGSITNTAEIVLNTATGSWGTITHVVVYDALTGGNLLWYAPITAQAVGANVTPKLPVGTATSTLA